MWCCRWLGGLGMLVVASLMGVMVAAAGPPKSRDQLPFGRIKVGEEAIFVMPPCFSPAANFALPGKGDMKPALRKSNPRDFSEELYPRVAPAVVYLATAGGGSGTGFVIHEDGWVLTNNHVAVSAIQDPQSGVLKMTAFFGQVNADGQMEVIKEGIPALVYRRSPHQDLALVKLMGKPRQLQKLPVVARARQKPRAGSDCALIGHPALGVLWTVRSGRIAGIGTFPDEKIGTFLFDRFLKNNLDQKNFRAAFNQVERCKVLLSSLGTQSGDSGSPVVNKDGELVGVHYAAPIWMNQVVAGFKYHVHLDEIEAFLGQGFPQDPPMFVPEPIIDAPFWALHDLNKDGFRETLTMGRARGALADAVLIDLNKSSPNLSDRDLLDPAKRKNFRYHFALHYSPLRRTFLDSDGDGVIDLILTSNHGDWRVDVVQRLVGGRWQMEKAPARDLDDPRWFADPGLHDRFSKLKDLAEKL